jgi:predicted 3-demethylubiquinone-9 3-methyltransferase (glyoxalase superfamily)
MPTITPSLWFDDNLQQAAEFYASVFPNSSVEGMYGRTDSGAALYGSFVLDGQRFRGINGGPMFTFSEAVSFEVLCADQDEVDYYWTRLTEGGGEESKCGWLKDRFGLSWQIVPKRLYELMEDPDPAIAAAATAAMMKMQKIVVAELDAAVANI